MGDLRRMTPNHCNCSHGKDMFIAGRMVHEVMAAFGLTFAAPTGRYVEYRERRAVAEGTKARHPEASDHRQRGTGASAGVAGPGRRSAVQPQRKINMSRELRTYRSHRAGRFSFDLGHRVGGRETIATISRAPRHGTDKGALPMSTRMPRPRCCSPHCAALRTRSPLASNHSGGRWGLRDLTRHWLAVTRPR